MKENVFLKFGFAFVITSFMVFSSITPVTFGHKSITKNNELKDNGYFYDRFDKYHVSEINPDEYKPGELPVLKYQLNNTHIYLKNNMLKSQPIIKSPGDPMDSPWPMYCHDVRHTGRSPYSTAGNPGFEKWWIKCDFYVDGSAVIDNNDTLYFGDWLGNFYAVDLINRSVKWKYDIDGAVQSSPAIDENGIIYIGTVWKTHGDYLYAFYPNGTLKWKFYVGNEIYSSPAIGDDGSIYFGSETDYIYALYPNGTLKWKYKTSIAVLSSPAIGADGTVYCGSHDEYLYAFYPDNGTLKWKYKTGHWIRTAPCIGDDGTIYVVSLDDHLHAVNPDGTRKWKTNVGAGTSPTIGQDGTIYCGYDRLHAVNPDDGSKKWSFNIGPERFITGGTPCNSADGTIIFGTSSDNYFDGEIIAVNPGGTEKWRRYTGPCEFAPIIDKDGTIYMGSRNQDYDGEGYRSIGFLHAYGELNPDAPLQPEIFGPKIVLPDIEYKYKFKSTSPLGRDIYYYVDWGDYNYSGWIGPFESGELVEQTHTWDEIGRYTIRVKPKDTDNLWGQWGVLNPRSKETSNSFFFNMLERFPILYNLLSILK
jgi:outer membrane protein assembly factor BamB